MLLQSHDFSPSLGVHEMASRSCLDCYSVWIAATWCCTVTSFYCASCVLRAMMRFYVFALFSSELRAYDLLICSTAYASEPAVLTRSFPLEYFLLGLYRYHVRLTPILYNPFSPLVSQSCCILPAVPAPTGTMLLPNTVNSLRRINYWAS